MSCEVVGTLGVRQGLAYYAVELHLEQIVDDQKSAQQQYHKGCGAEVEVFVDKLLDGCAKLPDEPANKEESHTT